MLAIAEHEHVPEIVAAGMANYLMHEACGPDTVRHMIVDDIRRANERGDHRHAHSLLVCLKKFLEEHPEAIPASARPTL